MAKKTHDKVVPSNKGEIQKAEKVKKKIGRPTVKEEKASCKISFYITPSELEKLEECAAPFKGLSAAQWVKTHLEEDGFIS